MRSVTGIAVALVGLAVAAGSPAEAQKKYTYNSYLPPGHLVNTQGVAPMLKEIEEGTKGSLTWTHLAGGQLFGAQAILASVGRRIAEAGGALLPSYTQSELRHHFIISDHHAFGADFHAANGAAHQTLLLDCEECQEDFKKQNVIMLGMYSVADYSLLCNKPVTSLADVKGLRVRTTGALSRMGRAMGATPVGMTSQDMVEALGRGQIDCAMGPVAWLVAYPIQDSVTHILEYGAGVYPGIGFMSMNLAAWNELSTDEKKVILRALPGAAARVNFGYAADGHKARALAAEKKITHTQLNEADVADFLAKHRENEKKVIAENARKRGVKNPEKIIDAYLANLEKWEGIMKQVGDDPDKYAAALWEHVYSKLDPAKM
jgi:TRAP-type transport system periplasmic protein